MTRLVTGTYKAWALCSGLFVRCSLTVRALILEYVILCADLVACPLGHRAWGGEGAPHMRTRTCAKAVGERVRNEAVTFSMGVRPRAGFLEVLSLPESQVSWDSAGMMTAHGCILGNPTWCLVLCGVLKKALIDCSCPHFTGEVTEARKEGKFEQSFCARSVGFRAVLCPLWQAQISGSVRD